jgi:hypothetical protein
LLLEVHPPHMPAPEDLFASTRDLLAPESVPAAA